MKIALSLLLIVVTSLQIVAQVERSGSPPEVAGYRLGADWQKIGRLMPCRSGPDGLTPAQKTVSNLYYPQLLAELRWCEPSDSVHLYFFRDTLFRIAVSYHLSSGSSPTATWNQQRDWAVETLGAPDSVIVRSVGDIDWVEAHWGQTRSQWQAVLANHATGFSHLNMAYCEFLPAVCEALFRPPRGQ